MDDHVKQLLLLGREHFQKREYEQAEYLLRQVLAKTDRFADVHHMLGVIAHAQADFAQAELHFDRAVQINPNYTEALLNLMVTYNDQGKYKEARRIFETIRQRDGGGEAALDPFARGRIANMHADVSQAYVDCGLVVEAIQELEKAIKLCPTFCDLRTRLAILYRDSGQPARAREQLLAAKEVNPRYTQARVLLGALLLSAGQASGAIEELQAVLEIDPEHKSAQTYLRLAQTALRRESEPPTTS